MTETLPSRPFRAFRLHTEGEPGTLTTMPLDELPDGDVVIRVRWSSVNYKDALAGTGRGRIARKYPLNGGIDLAGTVVESRDEAYHPGDTVLATGSGMSEHLDGGYAEYARLPSDAVLPCPPSLGPETAMAIGTAGVTAALALGRLQENGLQPASGPVVVTGASGGVGSFAIDLLAGQGYEVVAVSGKPELTDHLLALGADRVIGRDEVRTKGRPLERAHWAGAIDNVGNGMLADLVRTTCPWGSVVSIGLAGGQDLPLTVMPFILRGVSLIGITAANTPRERREQAWARLAGDWRPRHLDRIVSDTVSLETLPAAFERMLAGQSHGRTLVRID